jgi:hypothetical protein
MKEFRIRFKRPVKILIWPDTPAFASEKLSEPPQIRLQVFWLRSRAARNSPKRSIAGRACQKTIDYAEAKEAYFTALRAEMQNR